MYETTKFPEESTSEHSDLNCSNIFLDLSLKVEETKAKINNLNFKALAQQRKLSTKWKDNLLNIFANDMTDKRLIFKIYEPLIQYQKKKPTNKQMWIVFQRKHTDG